MIPDEISIPLKGFFSKYWPMIVLIIGCVIAAYLSVILIGKDNPIEQEAEKLIEIETGVKIDLTP